MLKYKLYDNSKDKTILLLHGLFGLSNNWNTIALKLSDKYNIIVPDMPNHGYSFRLEDFTYIDLANYVMDLIKYLDLEIDCFIGHSMGGKILMTLSFLYPIKKMMILDIAPKVYDMNHKYLMEALLKIDLTQITNKKQVIDILKKDIKDNDIIAFFLMSLKRDQGKFYWLFDPDNLYKNYDNITDFPLNDKIIDTPSMFLYGENSNYIKQEDKELIKSIFKNSSIIKIKDCGHNIHTEKADLFLEIARNFIDN